LQHISHFSLYPAWTPDQSQRFLVFLSLCMLQPLWSGSTSRCF